MNRSVRFTILVDFALLRLPSTSSTFLSPFRHAPLLFASTTQPEMAADEVQSATAQLRQMAITGGGAEQKVVAPPHPNLPLPRELRDRIWAALLVSECVRDKPWHTRPDKDRGQVRRP